MQLLLEAAQSGRIWEYNHDAKLDINFLTDGPPLHARSALTQCPAPSPSHVLGGSSTIVVVKGSCLGRPLMLTKVIEKLPGAYGGMPYTIRNHLMRAAHIVYSECHSKGCSALLDQYTLLPVIARLSCHDRRTASIESAVRLAYVDSLNSVAVGKGNCCPNR